MGTVAMYALAAFALLFLAVESTPTGVTAASPFKDSGLVNYFKYSAVVSAGQNEPRPYASKLQIQGKLLHHRHVKLPNDYADYLRFAEIKHTIFNGDDSKDTSSRYLDLDVPVRIIQEPFKVYYNSNQLEDMKFLHEEPSWSQKMKASVATILLEPFHRVNVTSESYRTLEKTIHGTCQVHCSTYTKEQDGKKRFYVRKIFEPRSCDGYVHSVLSDAKSSICETSSEEDLVTTSERVYEYEYDEHSKQFGLRKITADEKVNFLPWNYKSAGIQYITTSQVFELEKSLNEPDVKFDKHFNFNFTLDDQHYSHENIMDSTQLKSKIKEYLLMMVDYLKENHIDVNELHPEHKNVFDKLRQIMSAMDTDTLVYVLNHFNKESEKGELTRKIFLEIVPHLGTIAAWNFTKHVIEEQLIDDDTAVNMLTKLPLYVSNPSQEMVELFESYLKFDENKIFKTVRKSAILCYSILLNKAYKYVKDSFFKYNIEFHVYQFKEHLINENTYEMKIVYMMAMKNVGVGIYKHLAPIVRGEDVFFVNVDIPKPEKYRIAAMWAVANSISNDENLSYSLFWPILANRSLPLTLRSTAYELLVPRNPRLNMNLLMTVHSLMSQETDEHFFNYHYTTLKNMAETSDPCRKDTAEMMRKVFRLTKPRKIFNPLISQATVYDFFDTNYNFGQTYKFAFNFDEASGMTQLGYYEQIASFRKKSKQVSAIHWNLDGINLNLFLTLFKNFMIQEIGITDDLSMYQINEEKVLKLLRSTHGHKLFDKHIHVELWNMEKGYVTNVRVYFQNSLVEFLQSKINSYKPKSVVDVGEKFSLNWLNVYYSNQYQMTVLTDIGIPAVFYSELPSLTYTKLKVNVYKQETQITAKFEFETKFYRQLSYRMSFPNPFTNVTHAIERRMITDAAFPIDATISFNMETYNLKIVLPRAPESRFSVAGVKVHSVDEVKIENDRADLLKVHCTNCKHSAVISKGPRFKITHENVIHSIDTGLEFTSSIFDCNDDVSFSTEKQEWLRVLNSYQNNVNQVVVPYYFMVHEHGISNLMNSPTTTTCGKMFKISPCTIHSSSQIEMNWRFSFDQIVNSVNVGARGTIDSKTAANETMRFWDINMNISTSELLKSVVLHLTRKKSGEKNLKVCFEAEQSYPNFLSNLIEVSKQETNSYIELFMGYSDDDSCVTDDSMIKAAIKGELLQDQVEEIRTKAKFGSCFRNESNPLDIDFTRQLDWNCLFDLIKGTTLRRYTADVQYRKVPHEMLSLFAMIDDYLRIDNMAHITYTSDHTEPGNIKISVNYSTNSNYGNITVMNPNYSYELTNIQYGPVNDEFHHNDIVLENTVFDTNFLLEYYKGGIRPCIVHSNNFINDLNQTIPMEFKDWTLMSGDYELMSYAVFVKTVENNKIAVRFYISKHVLEIQPREESKLNITIDGLTVIESYEKEIILPPLRSSKWDGIYFKVSKIKQILLVESIKLSKVKLYYTPHNVVILPQVLLIKNIDGMCGHLGTTIYEQPPLIYTN